MTGAGSFADYLAALAPFAPAPPGTDQDIVDLCTRATAAIEQSSLGSADLADILTADPEIAPVLAAIAGLSQERFKTWLRSRFGTAGWIKLSRERASDLLTALDDDFSLLALMERERARRWTWADVLACVMAPRQRAGSSVQQGRDLEDAVEDKVRRLGVPYVPRTRFRGRAGRSAPADFAIESGDDAAIVVAVKGFDSTGSKLSDAAREIEEMAEVRTPSQFVFAVVDGQGWIRRQSDLRRIHDLWRSRSIDGMYARSQLNAFAADLERAAQRSNLL